jgi:uncharacterized membrane protein
MNATLFTSDWLSSAKNGAVEQKLNQFGCKWELQSLEYDLIRDIDVKRFQTRKNDESIDPSKLLDEDRVNQLVEFINSGDILLAVVLILHRGEYFAAEGRHRLAAHDKTKSQNGFAAYVIEEDDEQKAQDLGIKLSCHLNDINGERSGASRNEKNTRAETVDNCVNGLSQAFMIDIPDAETIKAFCVEWKIPNKRQIVREKFFLCRCHLLAEENKITLPKIRQGDAEIVFRALNRAEANQKKMLIETISHVLKTKDGSNNLVKVLEKTDSLPITSVITELQDIACLNSDNSDKTVHAKQSVEFITQLTSKSSSLIGMLKNPIALFGDEKERALGQSKNLKQAVIDFINKLNAN